MNQISFLLLPVIYAVGICSAFGASSVSVDLGGVILRTNRAEARSNAPALDAAHAYDYSIAGTCHGTGKFANKIPAGTLISDTLKQFDADADELLHGTVFDSAATFPFSVLQKKIHGSQHVGPVKISTVARIGVGIDASGIAGFTLDKASVLLSGHVDNSDTIVFEAGAQCTVAVIPPPEASAQPDLIVSAPPNAGIGNDIYNKDGTKQKKSYQVSAGGTNSVPLLVQNDGPSADTIFFNAVAGLKPLSIKYFDGNTDITAQAVSKNGYAITDLASGDAKLIRMQVHVGSSWHSGSSQEDGVVVTSSSNGKQDEVRVITIAK
jgi:hypothetical protein